MDINKIKIIIESLIAVFWIVKIISKTPLQYIKK